MANSNSFLESWRAFAQTSLEQRLGTAAGNDDAAQSRDAAVRAVDVFGMAAREVPAYARFLQAHDLDPETIRSPGDFSRVPPTTKENYARGTRLADLVRGGRLEAGDMFASSSGSTGEPTFWLRSLADELEVAWQIEQVFRDGFEADRRSTLAVVCFALGTWVGGLYTASCCRHLAAKGYPITVIAPGNHVDEILRVVERLGPQFEQVVLLGYPPFLKDVIDTGCARGHEWSRQCIRLVTAGEVFSEAWRELMWERAGCGGRGLSAEQDIPNFCASLYGTADSGVLACETPLSVRIRRFLAQRPEAARQLFGEPRMPTLAQYDPTSRYFETHEGRMLFTAGGSMPLVRYDILDTGGITPFGEMLTFLRDWKFDPLDESQGPGAAAGSAPERVNREAAVIPPAGAPSPRAARRLPFVHVFGRSHFAVSYYGANIYPESVAVGLEQAAVRDWVTGKFVLEALEDPDRNRCLRVTVELAPGSRDEPGRDRVAAESIREQLLLINSEFAAYVPPERQLPRITLLPAGEANYFPPGVKHRYTRG